MPLIDARIPMEFTFSFVDVAGFTAATSAHGDEAGADLAVRLSELATAAVSDRDAIVKSMGDAVLCVSTAPQDGVEWVVRLLAAVDTEPGFPLLRCGLSHGPAVERDGDFFGTSVNIAARVAALAGGGEVLCTRPVAIEASSLGFTIAPRGSRILKNLPDPVEVFEIEIRAHPPAEVDPVCQMRIDPAAAATAAATYAGRTYSFCSSECHDLFVANPPSYVAPDRSAER
jgi:class 3 adenylate cyclase